MRDVTVASFEDTEAKRAPPESSDDRWWQAALTVEGKIGNFDLTYAFARLDRDVDVEQDYNDYAFWYDTLAAYGAYTCSDFDPDTFTCAPGFDVHWRRLPRDEAMALVAIERGDAFADWCVRLPGYARCAEVPAPFRQYAGALRHRAGDTGR